MRSFVRAVALVVVPIAARAAGQMAPAVPVDPRVAELVGQLKDPDWDTRMEAATALGAMGPAAKAAIPTLVATLKDQVAPVRMKAIDALMFMRTTAAAAAPEIASALDDPDERVRVSAVFALPRVTPDPNSTVPLLKKALSDKGRRVRRRAAVELVQLKAELPSAVPILQEAVNDAIPAQRFEAIATLAAVVSPKERQALAALVAQDLKHAESEVRKQAILALGSLGPHAVPHLVGLLATPAHTQPNVGIAAMRALARLGPEARPALPVLQQYLQRKGVWLRPAQRAIAAIEGRTVAPEEPAGPLPPLKSDAPVAGPASPAATPSPAPSASPHR